MQFICTSVHLRLDKNSCNLFISGSNQVNPSGKYLIYWKFQVTRHKYLLNIKCKIQKSSSHYPTFNPCRTNIYSPETVAWSLGGWTDFRKKKGVMHLMPSTKERVDGDLFLSDVISEWLLDICFYHINYDFKFIWILFLFQSLFHLPAFRQLVLGFVPPANAQAQVENVESSTVSMGLYQSTKNVLKVPGTGTRVSASTGTYPCSNIVSYRTMLPCSRLDIYFSIGSYSTVLIFQYCQILKHPSIWDLEYPSFSQSTFTGKTGSKWGLFIISGGLLSENEVQLLDHQGKLCRLLGLFCKMLIFWNEKLIILLNNGAVKRVNNFCALSGLTLQLRRNSTPL